MASEFSTSEEEDTEQRQGDGVCGETEGLKEWGSPSVMEKREGEIKGRREGRILA